MGGGGEMISSMMHTRSFPSLIFRKGGKINCDENSRINVTVCVFCSYIQIPDVGKNCLEVVSCEVYNNSTIRLRHHASISIKHTL